MNKMKKKKTKGNVAASANSAATIPACTGSNNGLLQFRTIKEQIIGLAKASTLSSFMINLLKLNVWRTN